jgi:hypothetical protein
MVRPDDFAWNEQTAADNEFQHQPSDNAQTRQQALAEFNQAVELLNAAGVNVLVLEKDPDLSPQPDAVFPNNWFSVWPDHRVFLYPMRTLNRRREVRPLALAPLLARCGIQAQFNEVAAAPGLALEGTGALVFDHQHRRVYAARSERCDSLLAQDHAQTVAYQLLAFDTRSSAGRAFYHSNVVLSVGEQFAVIASDALCNPDERNAVLQTLRRDKRDVIEISLAQAEQAFCANVLQLATRDGARVVVMSQRAFDGFDAAQRQRLQQHGQLLALPISTIENVGGGSARCMLAEVFY